MQKNCSITDVLSPLFPKIKSCEMPFADSPNMKHSTFISMIIMPNIIKTSSMYCKNSFFLSIYTTPSFFFNSSSYCLETMSYSPFSNVNLIFLPISIFMDLIHLSCTIHDLLILSCLSNIRNVANTFSISSVNLGQEIITSVSFLVSSTLINIFKGSPSFYSEGITTSLFLQHTNT